MSDKVLAKPSDICCLKGSIHEGEAKGTVETILDIETYKATPPSAKANGNVVLFFPDIHGFAKNNFLLMDAIAECGYLTLGLDYFRGDPVWKHSSGNPVQDPNFDFPAWKDKHMPWCEENTIKWGRAVQEKYGNGGQAKFVCVGYCWGAKFVTEQLSKEGFCLAGAFAHPAFLTVGNFEKLSKPLLLSLAQMDPTFETESRNEAISILQDAGKTFHVQLFSGVSHGFALRADLSKPWEKWCKEQSLQGVVEWFDFFTQKA